MWYQGYCISLSSLYLLNPESTPSWHLITIQVFENSLFTEKLLWSKPQANPWKGKRKLYKAFDKRHSLIKSKTHPSLQPSSWSHLMNHLILFSEPALGTELGEMLADIFPCQLAHSSLRPASSAACRYAAPFPQRTRHLQAWTWPRWFTVSACRLYLPMLWSAPPRSSDHDTLSLACNSV